MPKTMIEHVSARQVLDSRGRPTVEADVTLRDGSLGRACAPSGASRGRHEARELRDGGDVYEGFGVLKAVANVKREIGARLCGMDAGDQRAVDAAMIELDGEASLGRLGANAILAVSLAAARAMAVSRGVPLYRHLSELAGTPMSIPMPMTNILSGGAHAGGGMDLQDFLCMPVGASSYSEALEMISRVRAMAGTLMQARGLSVLLADEGGLSPGFSKASEALDLMVSAIEACKLKPGENMAIAVDVAASEFYAGEHYQLKQEGLSLSSDEMSAFIVDMARRYPIVSVEDPLDQDDWTSWRALTQKLPHIQLVGDDLFATQVERIEHGIAAGAANAALIKLNQNGTLTGTLDAVAVARDNGYAAVISARSGETEDSMISDLAVGTGAGQIKIGSVRNSERLCKYNQLLRVEEEADLPFAGMGGVAFARS